MENYAIYPIANLSYSLEDPAAVGSCPVQQQRHGVNCLSTTLVAKRVRAGLCRTSLLPFFEGDAMIDTKIRCVSIAVLALLVSSVSWAQSGSTPLARGTLNYDVGTQMISCGYDYYTHYSFSNFSYTDENGQNQSLGDGLGYVGYDDSTGSSCNIWGPDPAAHVNANSTDSNGNGYSLQVTESLAGPSCVGCDIPVNQFTQTDSNSTTETLSEQTSLTEGFSWQVGFKPLGTGFGLRNETSWTWTNNESTGKINGTSNSMSLTFSSNTVDCAQNIPIFEDTVYHTFLFQQPPGDDTCP